MANKQIISITALLFLLSSCTGDLRVELKLSCTDLPDFDVCCSSGVLGPDAYAIVYYASSSIDSYVQQGKTVVLSDEHDPQWNDIFAFNVPEKSSARIKIDIMDSDVDADDYIGYAEFTMQDIIGGFGHVWSNDLSPSGNGRLRVQGTVFNLTRTDPEQEKLFAPNAHMIPNAGYQALQVLEKLVHPQHKRQSSQ